MTTEIGILRETEELRKFQNSAFETIARRKLTEDQNTILELSGRVQELQNEVNCMNGSEDFQDAESIRIGNSHVTSRPVSFPHPIPEGILRHSFVTPCRKEGPPSIWDTHGISGNVFANPDASSFAPYPQEWHQWNSSRARGMGPHGRSITGGGGLARVPNLRVCEHLSIGVAHAGGEG